MAKELIPAYMLEYIKSTFDAADAEQIIKDAQRKTQELLPLCSSYTKNAAKYLEGSIIPATSIYDVLTTWEQSKDKAYTHMQTMIGENTKRTTRVMWKRIGKLPFFFWMFRKMFTMGLSTQKDVWEVEFKANSHSNFDYNITRCLWNDAFEQLGCPELCQLYCENDNINFVDTSKYMRFERTKTLANGNKCCDFRFHSPK